MLFETHFTDLNLMYVIILVIMNKKYMNSEADKEKSNQLSWGETDFSVSSCFVLYSLYLTECIINIIIQKMFIFILYRMILCLIYACSNYGWICQKDLIHTDIGNVIEHLNNAVLINPMWSIKNLMSFSCCMLESKNNQIK